MTVRSLSAPFRALTALANSSIRHFRSELFPPCASSHASSRFPAASITGKARFVPSLVRRVGFFLRFSSVSQALEISSRRGSPESVLEAFASERTFWAISIELSTYSLPLIVHHTLLCKLKAHSLRHAGPLQPH